jgi:hypothetical protein
LTAIPGNNSKKKKLVAMRWVNSNLYDYYCTSDGELSNVDVPVDCFHCVDGICTCSLHHEQINKYYEDIVNAIKIAATQTVVTIPCSALKVCWTSELDRLKQDSINWHIWKNAGRPRAGIVNKIKYGCKLKYKQAIKEAYLKYDMLTLMN